MTVGVLWCTKGRGWTSN